jgi:hypothetical protein
VSPIPYKTPPVLPAYVLKMNADAARAEEAPAKKKRKSSGKPRKRRTQTVAKKGTEVQLYKWQELLDSYVFAPDDKVNATLVERDGKWTMLLVVDGKRYVGERPTLEEAYKATSDLLYTKAKKYWLRQDAHLVIAPWGYKLPEVL